MSGTAERLELFGVHFRDKLPKNFRVTAKPRFRGVEQAGGAIKLTPLKFPAEERVVFTMTLLNKDNIRDGEYSGHLLLSGSDPLVIISPDSIAIRFSAEPERTVALLPGNNPWPLELGTMDVWSQDLPVESLQSIVMQYNERARKKGGMLQVRIDADKANPTKLAPGKNFLINNRPSMSAVVKPPASALEVTIRAGRDLKPGTFRGKLIFQSDDLTVSGVGLNPDPDYPGALVLPWQFTVGKPPWPAWVRWSLIGTVVLAVPIGVLFGLAAFRGESVPEMWHAWMLSAGVAKAKLKDTALEVMEPRERRGQEIDLSTMENMTLGRGAEHFSDSEDKIELSVVVEGRVPGLRLKVVAGEVYLRRVTDRKESPVSDERLYDGDIIRLGRYKVRVNSFSLQRE